MPSDAPGSPLCRVLGIRVPVLLAGMAGGPTTPELVAAVTRAGGLGTFGLSGMSADAAAAAVRRARGLTDGPIAINVLVAPPTPAADDGADAAPVVEALTRELGLTLGPPPPPPAAARELVAAGLHAGAGVVSVGLGDPAVVRDLADAAGAPVVAMAASVDDARRAVAAGADVIVAQGAEAGGHRSNFTLDPDGGVPLVGTFALVPQVVAAVDVPVVAAGAVMDGRGLVAALALGAQGIQMGTRFLLARESGVPEGYRRRLLAARDTDTVITRAVSGRPARGVRNRLIEALEGAGPPGKGYPAQAGATGPLRAAGAEADEPEAIALWAGQAAALGRAGQGAEEILAEVMAEARTVIGALGGASI